MPSDSLPLSDLQEIDRLCDSFEAAWHAGLKPRIEAYMNATTLEQRTLVFRELLGREVELRRRSGELPEAADYLERFAAFDDLIQTVLNEPELRELTAIFPLTSADPATGFLAGEPLENTGPFTTDTRADVSKGQDGAIAARAAFVLPERVGRFRPLRLLGQGNFVVVLARDDANERDVAIKLGRPEKPFSRRRLMSLAEEAQRLEGLDHPGIVKILEFVPPAAPGPAGEPGTDGFLVLEYVAGTTLHEVYREGRLDPARLAGLLAAVAEAVHHAHTAGLVHRDLKPSNILIDLEGRPKVCDFGLAVDEEILRLRRGEVAGTLPYMAPEQVRGETNRLDGRTDIWAIGVILYRGLTGALPFRGSSTAECFEEILGREPRPPRQFGDDIPRELERICLRCLSRQMSDRYLTAADLADELKRWLADSSSERSLASVPPALPRGLRSFGGEDAAFFLSLLPGPRGSDGVPESIRFWKSRIEAQSGEAFSVGVVYGPSGGGKSSFVRAGLLPQLDSSRVRPIVVEAGLECTETRLLAELCQVVPQLPADCNLAEAIALVRDDPRARPEVKLLLVLDQLEQWLQGRPIEPSAELIRALRQCDGRRVQALLLVRDDFWMATTRLLRAVEVPLVEGVNAAAVELFDGRHARKVLEEFGRSLEQIPPGELGKGSEQSRFLDQAVAGLTGPDGRIVPVRLSLFVEVIRGRPWTLQTLRDLGGMTGIGIKFLEQAFDAPSAAPANRIHRNAAEAVLELLLPAPASLIRGAPRSGCALREASGYKDRPSDFADLLQVLDHDLRLITAVDMESPPGGNEIPSVGLEDAPRGTHYQLAHDYLIRPIRQWLERKRQSTSEGRARLRLQNITGLWLDRYESHRLPSVLEYAGILHNTRPAEWTGDERRLMRAATRHYLGRLGVLVALIAALAMGGRILWERQEARYALIAASSADDRKLLGYVAQLLPYKERVMPALQAREDDPKVEGREREVAGMLLYRFAPTAERGRYLRELLLRAGAPDRVELISTLLSTSPQHAGLAELETKLDDETADLASRLRAGCALAALEPEKLSQSEMAGVVLTRALLDEGGRHVPAWIALLGRESVRLVEPLGQLCRDEANPTIGIMAAEALAEVLKRQGDAETIARMMVDSRPEAAGVLLHELAGLRLPEPGVEFLMSVLRQREDDPLNEAGKDRLAERQALAAIGLEVLGEPGWVSSLLRLGPDGRVRALLIHRLAEVSLGQKQLLERMKIPQAEPAERQALLMIWAEMRASGVPSVLKAEVVKLAEEFFAGDPDPGVHSAADLLLLRWGQNDLLTRAEAKHRQRLTEKSGMRWLLGPEGITFAVIPPSGVFRMGSPEQEEGRIPRDEQLHYRKIDRTIAMATREISIAQFHAFDPKVAPDGDFAREPNCSYNRATWFDAARYCNWLSQRDEIPRSQWCYPEPIQPGVTLPENLVERTGYRLPTEAEWEYVCRAGTTTPRFFGVSDELLPRYGWTWLNAFDHVRPPGQLLPNPYGMFDMLGNVWEWCHDGPDQGEDPPPYSTATSSSQPMLDHVKGGMIPEKPFRVLRGGAFDYSPRQARAAYRYAVGASLIEGTIGFRVVRTLPAPQHATGSRP